MKTSCRERERVNARFSFKEHARSPSWIFASFFLFTLAASVSQAATFTVTNVNDSGPGSLRQAIIDANSNLGADQIKVAISRSSSLTVNLLSQLPAITEQVLIDGANSSRKLLTLEGSTVSLDANNDCLAYEQLTGVGNIAEPDSTLPMLWITNQAGGTEIRNLILRNSIADPTAWDSVHSSNVSDIPRSAVRGPCEAIKVDGADGVTIRNNTLSGFILGQATINVPSTNNSLFINNTFTNTNDNLEISGGSNNVITNNNITGTHMFSSEAITLWGPSNCTVTRNTVRNVLHGIAVYFGSNNSLSNNIVQNADQIGMLSVFGSGINMIGNVINGAPLVGIAGPYGGFSDSEIAKNVITNGGAGIDLQDFGSNINVHDNLVIGMVSTGINVAGAITNVSLAKNVIAFTGQGAVDTYGNTILAAAPAVLIRTEDYGFGSPTSVSVLSNLFYGNKGLGIDLTSMPWSNNEWDPPYGPSYADLRTWIGDGVTPNDTVQPNVGPNSRQNYPVITSARNVGGQLNVQGTLLGVASTAYLVQVFRPDTGAFLGQLTLTTDATGFASFNNTLQNNQVFGVQVGTPIVTTATSLDSSGNPLNTSEFSQAVLLSPK